MLRKNLANALKRFRNEQKLTQIELAERLKISQAHLSRLESGRTNASTATLNDILRIVGSIGERYAFTSKPRKIENWELVTFSFPHNICGDRIEVAASPKSPKFSIFHCDAAGSEVNGSAMAEQLTMGFHAITGGTDPLGLSPERVYAALNHMIKATKGYWDGNQSATIIVGKSELNTVDLVNAGMPNLLFYSGQEGTVELLQEPKVAPLGEARRRTIMPETISVKFREGDVLMGCSDGFVDEFQLHMTKKIETYFGSIARAQKSDVKGISKRLLSLLGEALDNKSVDDDISLFMLGKNQ